MSGIFLIWAGPCYIRLREIGCFPALPGNTFPRDKLSALPRERVDAAREEGMELLNRNHLMSSTDEEYRQFYEYYALLAKALPELGLTQTDLEKGDRR